MGKISNEVKEYVRGVEDAREGREYNDGSDGFTALMTLGLGGGPRPDSDSYREGYRDGKK